LIDRRLGKAAVRRVPVDKLLWMLGEYRTQHMGWNVKHFHEHISAAWVLVGGHLEEDAAAHGGSGGAGGPARGATNSPGLARARPALADRVGRSRAEGPRIRPGKATGAISAVGRNRF
jgi:hypothetical protein